MDLYDAIRNRRSVRAYRRQAVEPEKLQRILEAARQAPTARNRQAFRIVVVGDAAMRLALADASEQPFMAKAPLILAVVGLDPQRVMHCGIPADPVDCAIVLEHMALAAVAEGLGACWIGHFDQDACRKLLGVPQSAKIVEMLTLGYPMEGPVTPKTRKDLSELVSTETF